MKLPLCILLGLLLTVSGSRGASARIKDLAMVAGARENQLYGYGLVIGLAGQGDKDPSYTVQAMSNLLKNAGVNLPAMAMTSKNVAAVWVTADIQPFAREGTRLDVVVSSLGDAKTLQGGVLVQTPLMGADGNVYAVAQGPLSIGGFVAGNAAAAVAKNHPTVGQIVNGALIEREIPAQVIQENQVQLVLRESDFTSASRMAEAINAGIHQAYPDYEDIAVAQNASSVLVDLPPMFDGRSVDFIRALEEIEMQPDIPARVVINERTGTIVATSTVQISECAVSHGNITVSVATTTQVSQPGAFSRGPGAQTLPFSNTETGVTEQLSSLVPLPEMPTVDKIATHLNALGVTPRDMMAIFQAMKQAGALHAELMIQ